MKVPKVPSIKKRWILLLLATVLLLGNRCGDDYDYEPAEEEAIETLSFAVSPRMLSPSEVCTVTLSGTIPATYADAKVTFSLSKRIDGDFESVLMYMKDDSTPDWLAVSGSTYPIPSEEYAAVSKTLSLLLPAAGDYCLSVSVRATDTEKENTVGVFYGNKYLIVGD